MDCTPHGEGIEGFGAVVQIMKKLKISKCLLSIVHTEYVKCGEMSQNPSDNRIPPQKKKEGWIYFFLIWPSFSQIKL